MVLHAFSHCRAHSRVTWCEIRLWNTYTYCCCTYCVQCVVSIDLLSFGDHRWQLSVLINAVKPLDNRYAAAIITNRKLWKCAGRWTSIQAICINWQNHLMEKRFKIDQKIHRSVNLEMCSRRKRSTNFRFKIDAESIVPVKSVVCTRHTLGHTQHNELIWSPRKRHANTCYWKSVFQGISRHIKHILYCSIFTLRCVCMSQ